MSVTREAYLDLVKENEGLKEQLDAARAEIERLKEWYGVVPAGSALDQIPLLHAEIARLQAAASASALDCQTKIIQKDAEIALLKERLGLRG